MSIFHKRHRDPYHTENSLRGIRKAAKAMRRVARRVHGRLVRRLVRRWTEIDLDLTMTKDGVIVNSHWGQPLAKDGFRDPEHKIGLHARTHDLTWVEVKRLRGPQGYRINSLRTALRQCARSKIGARLEPKVDVRFEDPDTWRPIKVYADHLGVPLRGYSIRHLGGHNAGQRRVDAMKAAGIPSKVIR